MPKKLSKANSVPTVESGDAERAESTVDLAVSVTELTPEELTLLSSFRSFKSNMHSSDETFSFHVHKTLTTGVTE